MSLSTLPDIFKRAQTTPLIARKQGGPFSLHLNYQSADKYLPSRAGFAPGDQSYLTLNATKRKSVSTASMRPKKSNYKAESNSKPNTARDKMFVTLKEEVEFCGKTPSRQRGSIGIINLSNFPYEMNRKMNNMTIDL